MQFEAWLDQARSAATAAWAVLSSPLAQRAYVLVAILLSFGGTILAYRAQTRIRDIAEGKDVLAPSRPGRPPLRAPALKRRLAELKGYESNFLGALFAGTGQVVAFGHLLPTLGLFAAVYLYGWLTMGEVMLVGPEGPVGSPTLRQAALFCLTQLAGGGLADTLEVFGVSWTSLRVDPAEKSLLALLVVYRLLVGAFAAILLLSIQAMVVLRRNLGPLQADIRDKLRALETSA